MSEQPEAPEPDDWWMGLVGRTPSEPGTPDADPPAPTPTGPPTEAPAAPPDAPGAPAPATPPGPPIPATPSSPPAAASSSPGPATGEPADDDQDDEDPLRLKGADLLPEWWRSRPKRAAQPERAKPPRCPHARTVPVHVQPTGEHVASICLDCDEQLDVPNATSDDEAPAPTPAPKAAPAPGGRRRGGTPTARKPHRRDSELVGRSYVRPIAFTLSAGLFGYSIGLVDVLGGFLPAADHGASGTVGAALAIGGGFGAWRVLGAPGVAAIVPAGIVGRAIASLAVAFIAPGLAPDLVQLLNQYGVYIGLDASAVALLAASTAVCGGLYWLVDRRFTAMPALVRWLVRVPLASALLAVALYGPGPR